jgi:hypothetical protein
MAAVAHWLHHPGSLSNRVRGMDASVAGMCVARQTLARNPREPPMHASRRLTVDQGGLSSHHHCCCCAGGMKRAGAMREEQPTCSSSQRSDVGLHPKLQPRQFNSPGRVCGRTAFRPPFRPLRRGPSIAAPNNDEYRFVLFTPALHRLTLASLHHSTACSLLSRLPLLRLPKGTPLLTAALCSPYILVKA